MSTESRPVIHWRQIYSLLALDLAILISWIAYHKYQPALVAQFGFMHLVVLLVITQAVILFLTPPIAGYMADRVRKKKGESLPVINIGINLVSMVFMVVALTVFVNPEGPVRYLFLVLVVLWLISMNIFHSPAISTVELFVPREKMPQVIALFAVVMDLTQAIEPSINDIILLLGGPITFMAGGILVFVTGFIFMRTVRKLTSQGGTKEMDRAGSPERSDFITVFGLGIVMGIGIMLFFELFPAWIEERMIGTPLESLKGTYGASILIAIAAILAWPLGIYAEKMGVKKMAVTGSVLLILLAIGIWLSVGWIALILFILFPLAFSILSVTTLPLAFRKLDVGNKVLGIGIFFSGTELPNSIADIIQVL